eukprot:CAMPEP_0203902422 /NCGR_PEP_ID=MMETSP0359-20131031/44491_1 /ASSEMBLY_ACC=CAM_ASM_000338 /TAXON_ID=268821 /ORGANISM="Scrippsiella Hangoei, Strain SHTV-5" /LENGTH=131 /DNA_ID=CAMNT_0050826273 /DNA_START=62 /DNA_END=454 /DNA_ORIENTATION=+
MRGNRPAACASSSSLRFQILVRGKTHVMVAMRIASARQARNADVLCGSAVHPHRTPDIEVASAALAAATLHPHEIRHVALPLCLQVEGLTPKLAFDQLLLERLLCPTFLLLQPHLQRGLRLGPPGGAPSGL